MGHLATKILVEAAAFEAFISCDSGTLTSHHLSMIMCRVSSTLF
jgi:hypothetical protein